MALSLTFSTGETATRSFASLTKKKGLFSKFKDPKFFAKVKISNGTIEWPGEIDFCVDALFDNGRSLIKPARLKKLAT